MTPILRIAVAIVAGVLVAQPFVRARERREVTEAGRIGDELGTIVGEHLRSTDRRERVMILLAAISCVAAVAAAVAAFVALGTA